jgi:hypothetical protein
MLLLMFVLRLTSMSTSPLPQLQLPQACPHAAPTAMPAPNEIRLLATYPGG